MPVILSILPLIQMALGILGQFKGSAVQAQATGYVQDATNLITALVPLVQQYTSGKEVTAEDLAAALAGMHRAVDDLDALIAAKDAQKVQA